MSGGNEGLPPIGWHVPGGLRIVGERGPELVDLPRGSGVERKLPSFSHYMERQPIIIPAETLQAESIPAPTARHPIIWALWVVTIALVAGHLAWVASDLPGADAINAAIGNGQ